MRQPLYPVLVQSLPESEGGGYLATFPDLPGCMGDGETYEEAIADLILAMDEWIAAAEARGMRVPEPRELVEKAQAALQEQDDTVERLQEEVGRLQEEVARLRAITKRSGPQANDLLGVVFRPGGLAPLVKGRVRA